MKQRSLETDIKEAIHYSLPLVNEVKKSKDSLLMSIPVSSLLSLCFLAVAPLAFLPSELLLNNIRFTFSSFTFSFGDLEAELRVTSFKWISSTG